MLNVAKEAVDRAGGQAALALKVGVSQQAVQQWVAKGCIPAARAAHVGRITKLPVRKLLDALDAKKRQKVVG